MPIDITLPKLGDGIESGDVLEVFVKEGETIAADQPIVELETDKATVPVPSTHAGKVVKIHVKPGQTVPIGAPLISLEAAAGAAAPAKPAPAPPKAEAPKPAPAPKAEAPKPAASKSETPKPVTPSKPAPAPKPAAAEHVNAALDAAEAALQGADAASDNGGGIIAAGPAIRRFAREVGVDLARVSGSGPGGRIIREDVLEVVRRANRSAQEPAVKAAPAAAAQSTATATATKTKPAPAAPVGEPGSDAWGPVRIEKMAKIRKTIANKMHESWTTIPKVTNFDDADITALEKIRQDNKDDYSAAGIKLTTMPFVIKAVALALRHHPTINASLDLEKDQIIYKDYVNVGIAVDSERGLVVPSLRDADKLSIPDIARALAEIAEKVRTGQFTIDDLRGSTFSISNLGAIGGTYSTPIINPPEVAILLTGRARKLAVVNDADQVEVRLMMPLSLSYDHRLVDGAAAARFLNDVIKYLKAPSRLLLAP